MKRTPIRRGTKGLARTGNLKPRSATKAKIDRQRSAMFAPLAEAGEPCRAGARIVAHEQARGKTHLCTGVAACFHELRKRSSGGSTVNPKNLLPVCWNCNNWAEDWPDYAKELGLVIREGHPLWDEVSKRHDRKGSAA